MLQNCKECVKLREIRKEPLIPTPLPDYPWQLVGTDLFDMNQKHYLLVVDYFSWFPEVIVILYNVRKCDHCTQDCLHSLRYPNDSS